MYMPYAFSSVAPCVDATIIAQAREDRKHEPVTPTCLYQCIDAGALLLLLVTAGAHGGYVATGAAPLPIDFWVHLV